MNTKRSTEAEVVRLSDYVPFDISARLFMKLQGYLLKSNVLYQDNQSEISMESDFQDSCTGNYFHTHIRYLFIKDRQEKVKFSVRFCLVWK